MQKIKLAYNKIHGQHYALVDDKDYELVKDYKWNLQKGTYTFYATTWIKGKNVYMHRLLTGATKGQVTDHMDGNGLNNQQANMRTCSNSENMRNQKKQQKGKSKYKGLYLHQQKYKDKTYLMWQARIQLPEKRLSLGYFKDEEEAARAYDAAAVKHFGPFALLNFPVDVTG